MVDFDDIPFSSLDIYTIFDLFCENEFLRAISP